jgi:Lon protease-like protein
VEQARLFGMDLDKKSSLSAIGCSASIVTVIKKYDDGRLDIAAEGGQRFEIRTLNQERSFLQAEVEYFEDEPSTVGKSASDTVIELHEKLFDVLGQAVEIEQDAASLSFHLAHALPVDLDFKQALLGLRARLRASGNGHVH